MAICTAAAATSRSICSSSPRTAASCTREESCSLLANGCGLKTKVVARRLRSGCAFSQLSFTDADRLVAGMESSSGRGRRKHEFLVVRAARGKFGRTIPHASSDQTPAATEKNSILCEDCGGNGAVVCSQCKGEGLNTQDHFGGRFKAGTICWLCRGKKQTLCGNCNGAGFMGGFLNTQDE